MSDIDFPVSECWAEFYKSQGFSVKTVISDDAMREERRIRKRRPDPDVVRETVTRWLHEMPAETPEPPSFGSFRKPQQAQDNKKLGKVARLRKWSNTQADTR